MGAIHKSFVAAQKAFGPAIKSSVNPHFKSRYADLAACIDAVIDGLNNNGIALLQFVHESEKGVCVETVFLHESGEAIQAGKLTVPVQKQDAQGYGSALTYARRYSLLAACGLAPEDDDGNAAVQSTKTKQPPTLYSLKSLEAEHIEAARTYLLASGAVERSANVFESAKRLPKLTQCIVDEN